MPMNAAGKVALGITKCKTEFTHIMENQQDIQTNMTQIRHSLLPKIAACPCYAPKEWPAGPAAERGTAMDEVFRALLSGDSTKESKLNKDDLRAVRWAVNEVQVHSMGHEIISEESKLKVKTPGLQHIGTEDARCPDLNTSFDLKSGQIRSYYEQAAAYSLGNMDAHFQEEWTFLVVFADQESVTRYHFTYAQAEAIVQETLAKYNDQAKMPSRCDYCSWCANRDTCVALTAPVTEVRGIVESGVDLAQVRMELANDPIRLGRFLELSKVFESELVKPLKEIAKEKLQAGEEVPGWKLSTSKPSESFDRVAIVGQAIAGKWGMDDLVDALGGSMSGKDFRALSEKYRQQVDDSMAKIGDSVVRIIESKPPKVKKAK